MKLGSSIKVANRTGIPRPVGDGPFAIATGPFVVYLYKIVMLQTE